MITLSAIRGHYKKHYQRDAERERQHYAEGDSLPDRIRKAAWARNAKGKKNRHQWRIPDKVLKKFAEKLVDRKKDIGSASSFTELLTIVGEARIKGIGEMTIYDTAERIGAGQGLQPKEIFLHKGTKTGAKNLKLNTKRTSIPIKDMPAEFRRLSAADLENLLCIYAAYFDSKESRLPKGCCGGEGGACG